MKYSPETLIQIYMNGSLTEEAQTAFDHLMKNDPVFSERVMNAMAERMGPVPEEAVNQIVSRLDAKVESLWVNHQPSKAARFFRIGLKCTVVLAGVAALGYFITMFWPKLLAVMPQVDLSGYQSNNTHAPKTLLAPPVIMAPQIAKNPKLEIKKVSPAVDTVAQNTPVPTPEVTPPPSNASNNTQVGNSMRLVVDTDKEQTVQISVLGPDGNLVRHLYQGFWIAGSHFVDWDGKDDFGNSALPGSYTVVVQAGEKKMSGIVTIKPY